MVPSLVTIPSTCASARTRSNPYRSSPASRASTQYWSVPRRICASSASCPCSATMRGKVPDGACYANRRSVRRRRSDRRGFRATFLDSPPYGWIRQDRSCAWRIAARSPAATARGLSNALSLDANQRGRGLGCGRERSAAAVLVPDHLERDLPAAVQAVPLERLVADEDRRLPRRAPDLAVAEVGVDLVLPAAAVDEVRAVACVDEVLAGAAGDAVGLPGGLAARLVVAPQDVADAPGDDRVVAMAAEQLVVLAQLGRAQRAALVGLVHLEVAVDLRPTL